MYKSNEKSIPKSNKSVAVFTLRPKEKQKTYTFVLFFHKPYFN